MQRHQVSKFQASTTTFPEGNRSLLSQVKKVKSQEQVMKT